MEELIQRASFLEEEGVERTIALGDGLDGSEEEAQQKQRKAPGLSATRLRPQGCSMSFRLSSPETIPSDLRRLVEDELDTALTAYTCTDQLGLRVHEARRALKRARAVLRLIQSQLGEVAYRRENSVCRKAGRALAAARDSDVMITTARAVAGARGSGGLLHDRRAAPSTAYGVARRLAARSEPRLSALARADDTRREQVEALQAMAGRIGRWPLRDIGFDSFSVGLRRSYGQGRQYQRRAARAGSVRLFHEWRKRAKDLRHQLEILECAWPAVLGTAALELHRLTDLTGEANDLSVLLKTLQEEPELTHGLRGSKRLREVIEHRRSAAWQEGLSLGARIYAEAPAAFLYRVRRYWEQWSGC